MSVRILSGDCRDVLKTLPDESVHCVVTSPPYFGLRDYGAAGQVGLEPTHIEYVNALADTFEEVRRVLRADGTCWLNLGDSYAGSWGAQGHRETPAVMSRNSIKNHPKTAANTGSGSRTPGLKAKDLIGVPWRVAFALQDRGWWLRGDHVWGKPNGMPESTEDRPTRGHEYVFMLTKSARYWYDCEAVRTAPKASTITRLAQDVEAQEGSARANGGAKTNGKMKAVAKSTITGAPHGRHFLGDAIPEKERRSDKQRGHTRRHAGFNDRWDAMERNEQIEGGANLRSIWWVSPAQFSEAHFAVMPDRVAEICIRAGCPAGGVVLDPFGGAGTVGLVADRLQRDAILIELNPEYAAMAERRIRGDASLFAEVAR